MTGFSNKFGETSIRALPVESWRWLEEHLSDVKKQGVSHLSALEGGGIVEKFEMAFAEISGAEYALAVSSGTAALHSALLACDVGPGDEVIVSPYGWGQTVGSVLATGATPVFADIEPETGNLDPEQVQSVLSERTRVVLVTHVHGLPADMKSLTDVCRKAGIKLVADAAQALGATYAGKPVGAWGDIACFSLGRGKVISAGEGGVAVTSDPDLLERMILVSQHPLRCLREVEDPGLFNSVTELSQSYRFLPMAASAGLGQIAQVNGVVEEKRATAARLSAHLQGLSSVELPGDHGGAQHSYYFYVMRCCRDGSREEVLKILLDKGVECQPGPVRSPIHFRPPFQQSPNTWFPKAYSSVTPHPTWNPGSCPVAERRCRIEDLYLQL